MNNEENKVSIICFRPENSQRIYSNYVEVSANPMEVSIKFCDVKPPANKKELEDIKKKKIVFTSVVSEVILPYEIAKAFLEALKNQLEKRTK